MFKNLTFNHAQQFGSPVVSPNVLQVAAQVFLLQQLQAGVMSRKTNLILTDIGAHLCFS
jgi:hypothetical protein